MVWCGNIALAIWQKQVELWKLSAGSRKTLGFQGQVIATEHAPEILKKVFYDAFSNLLEKASSFLFARRNLEEIP